MRHPGPESICGGTGPASIVIGIPVRNEVVRLPRLLSALARQRGAPPFTLCLFFDNCDDGSRELVERLAPSQPFRILSDGVYDGGIPNAGLARRKAMALALANAPDGILFTTDADSEPARDWISTTLAALGHADLVAGKIARFGTRSPDMLARIGRYLDQLHVLRRTIDPVPWEALQTHHWTSSASLAMRSNIYRSIGGFSPLPNGEDAALADAAARHGYRMRRDAGVIVQTSTRRVGRAGCGFAAALAMFDAVPTPPEVAHPADEAWRFRMQAIARAAFDRSELRDLIAGLGLQAVEADQVASECANGEAFAARIVGAPPGGMRTTSLDHAEMLMAGYGQVELVGAA